MLKRLFRRSASAAALCHDSDAYDDSPLAILLDRAHERIDMLEMALRARGKQVATLEGMIQRRMVEIEAMRGKLAIPAPVAPSAEVIPLPVRPTRKRATTPKADKMSKPVKLSALEFWSQHAQAVEAIRAVHGERWDLAPRGQTALATLPAEFRSYVNAKGVKVVRPKIARIPAEMYWPSGKIPAQIVEIVADPVRAEPGVKLVYNAAWHRAHGYEWFKGIKSIRTVGGKGVTMTRADFPAGWVHALEMPYLEGLRIARAQRLREQRKQRDLVKYGPQPEAEAA